MKDEQAVIHDRILIERVFEAPASLVWRAWSEPDLRDRWENPSSTWQMSFDKRDFRAGGTETCRCGPDGEMTIRFTAHYPEIVPERRIVYTTVTSNDEHVSSVSVTSVEFEGRGSRTAMRFVESIALIDGRETIADRTAGTEAAIAKLQTVIDEEANKVRQG